MLDYLFAWVQHVDIEQPPVDGILSVATAAVYENVSCMFLAS